MRPLPRVVLALALLSPLVPALPPALAQECGCNCGQPILGTIAAGGSCQCPCDTLSIPGINPESLSGPPRPAKAGGPAPEWQVEPFDDDFGPPGFGVW